MKKNLELFFIFVVFMAGCGSNPEKEQSFKGVVEQRDYIAEGMKYLQDSNVVSAIQSFDMAIKQDPTNTDNYIVLGEVYMRLKNYARAEGVFSAATRVDPNNGEAFYLLAMSKIMGFSEREGEALVEAQEGAVVAAQKSADLFMQQRDEERFKRSVILLKSLVPQEETPRLEK